jgi:hypothetical protein
MTHDSEIVCLDAATRALRQWDMVPVAGSVGVIRPNR